MVIDATSKQLVIYLSVRPSGFDLHRHEWVLLNRTNQGHCAYLMQRWRFGESPYCDCDADQQTINHIINECPRRRFPGKWTTLNSADPDAVEYFMNLNLNL
jgi:hypothetical protein